MPRSDVLSVEAIEFLEANRCPHEYPIEHLKEQAKLLRVPLSAVQLETVANLWNVEYLSRAEFSPQQPRHLVTFFRSFRGESIWDYLVRCTFGSPAGAIVGDCETDSTFELDGLYLDERGALVTEPSIAIYRSAYMVVERDTFLQARRAEYEGSFILETSVTPGDVESRLGSVTLHAASSDVLNALWYGDDAVFLYRGWFKLVQTAAAPVLCVFGRDKNNRVFADTHSRLDDLGHRALDPTEIANRWKKIVKDLPRS